MITLPKTKTCIHGVVGISQCKICSSEATKKWYENHPHYQTGRFRKKHPAQKKHVLLCPHGVMGKGHCEICKKSYGKKRANKIKVMVIEHFGGRCACCGESNIAFLTIGHVNDDGALHRQEVGAGSTFYRKLFKDDFKTEYELAVECFNCNFGKKVNHGICPHKQKNVIENKV